MYVVSINDLGEERNFLATTINFIGPRINATINGMQREFDVGQLIDIEAVDVFVQRASSPQALGKQRSMS
jgi:hypothetical protein